MRNRKILLFLLTTGSLLALPRDGRAQPTLDDSIAALSPYVGQWEGRMEAYGSRPPGTVRVSCEPICGGSYLNMKVSFAPQGSPRHVNVETVVIGYNSRTKALHAWSFAKAAQAQSDITLDGTKLTMKNLTYAHTEGHQSIRTIEYEFKAKNEFTVRITDVQEHGEATPDWPTIVFRPLR